MPLSYQGVCQYLYDRPEGLDAPFDSAFYQHSSSCKNFTSVVAKAGDVFITHGFLPHATGQNHLHYARVITNPHVNLTEPFNLNREDGDYVGRVPSLGWVARYPEYPFPSFISIRLICSFPLCLRLQLTSIWDQTLCEQVILRALDRTSIPEYKPSRPRFTHYPRTAYFKRNRVAEELDRMIKASEAKGLGADSVDSVYLRGEEAILEHERRNGYDKKYGPYGVEDRKGMKDEAKMVFPDSRHVVY